MSTSTAPGVPQKTLLSLPAELRNNILALALTTSYDLLHVQARNTTEVQQPFNQLKLVNRQLYSETEDIEIQHNNLRFGQAHNEDEHPLRKANTYTAGLAPHKRSWIRSVTLAPLPHDGSAPKRPLLKFWWSGGDYNVTPRDFTHFCTSYPDIAVVNYMAPEWVKYDVDEIFSFMLTGTTIQNALRGPHNASSFTNDWATSLRLLGAQTKFRVLPSENWGKEEICDKMKAALLPTRVSEATAEWLVDWARAAMDGV